MRMDTFLLILIMLNKCNNKNKCQNTNGSIRFVYFYKDSI